MKLSGSKPLSTIRALELSEIWAGPFCGCLMGDMGAEVIKVESIQRIGRGPINPPPNAGGYPDDDPGNDPWNRQSNFNAIDRNKKSLTLDLKTEEGLNTFKDLVAQSDVVFCNYARTVMENFGLSYDEVRKIKPDIIYMLMPGYGNTGPYADYRSMGMAIDAITGHSFLRGYPDMDHSSNSLVHHPDAVAATNGVMAIASALVHRTRTGEGQFIDMSQAE
ncbi:MAG: CoA transferase, partial [Chloroflexota bacterium]|nr:CoA transferase [Chloroflexota bacterium]